MCKITPNTWVLRHRIGLVHRGQVVGQALLLAGPERAEGAGEVGRLGGLGDGLLAQQLVLLLLYGVGVVIVVLLLFFFHLLLVVLLHHRLQAGERELGSHSPERGCNNNIGRCQK